MSSTARFDELKKKFDENPRRYFAPLANEFRKTGDAEQAVMICEEFLPQQPGHMSGHIVYGQALFDLGRLDDARTVFETALTLDPENLIALRHLGDIARAHGDLDTARHWYQRVLEADPRNEEVQALITSLDAGPAPVTTQGEAAPTPASEQAPMVDLATAFEAPAAAPPPLPTAAHVESLLELDVVEEHALGAPQAEGFEPMEFTAPSTPQGGGLDDQLESAEFTPPSTSVAPLDGLEDTALGAFDASHVSAPLPSLPDLEPTADVAASAAPDQPPVDIPPEVIAAEAELIDAREATSVADATETVGSYVPAPPRESAPAGASPTAAAASPPPPPPPRVTPSQPFVTETMAELYMKQGFREQALDVYKLLLAASPDNQRLRDRVAELQPREDADSGPNVREFFARLAARRPGGTGAIAAAAEPPANDDFASFDSFETVDTAESGEVVESASPAPTGERVADRTPSAQENVAEQGGGSIDALFGQRPVGQADASAASALAQAFGSGSGASEPPAITGRPARAAAGELSLDSVFRDGGARPPRSAQSFSFDQFFSESAAKEPPAEPGTAPTPSQGTNAQAEPAERAADDIEQFNSWLQGLKQR